MARQWQPGSTLPPLYAAWIDELLEGPIPAETEASCSDCAMCADGMAASESPVVFNPATKCCTYVPALPNYLVGRVLEDDDPAAAAGRASVERRIDERVGVTPLGVQAPPAHSVLYGVGGTATFGKSRTLRCPHYREDAGGACGIWRHRNGVCSTWFCKHVRGATGQRFWHALDELLAIVERELARWCLVRLDVEPAVLSRLLPRGTNRQPPKDVLDGDSLDGRVDEPTYAALWGRRRGRERELYRESAALVSRLRWPDVLDIAGGSGEALARVVSSAHQALLGTDVPDRLVPGPLQVFGGARDHVRVAGYSGFDPLDLPRILVDALPCFDGRPTAAVLREIRAKRRVNLQPALVRRLVDFGVLIPAGPPPRNRA